MCARIWLTTTGGRRPDAGLAVPTPKTAVSGAELHKSAVFVEGATPSQPLVNYCTMSATSGKQHAHAVRQHLQQPLTAAAAPHKVPQGPGTVCFATPLTDPPALAAPLASAGLPACLSIGVQTPQQLRIGPPSQTPTLLHGCRQHYSADRMSLVVMGGESLDQLEGWVRELFTPVSSGQLQRPTFFGAGMPFEVRSLHAEVLRDSQ